MHKAFTAMTTKICKGQERKHREPSVTHMHAHEHTCTSVWRREIHHRSAVQCHEHTCTHVHQDVGTFDSILIEPLRCLSSSLFKPLTFGSLGTVASAESLLLSVFGLRTWLCVCACLNVCGFIRDWKPAAPSADSHHDSALFPPSNCSPWLEEMTSSWWRHSLLLHLCTKTRSCGNQVKEQEWVLSCTDERARSQARSMEHLIFLHLYAVYLLLWCLFLCCSTLHHQNLIVFIYHDKWGTCTQASELSAHLSICIIDEDGWTFTPLCRANEWKKLLWKMWDIFQNVRRLLWALKAARTTNKACVFLSVMALPPVTAERWEVVACLSKAPQPRPFWQSHGSSNDPKSCN